MGQALTTRRAVAGAIGLAAPVAALAGAQAALPARTAGGVSPALTAAIARYRHADLECARYHREEHGPRREHWEAALEALPHHRTRNSYANVSGERVTLSTESRASVAAARSALTRIENGSWLPKPRSRDNEEYIATISELVGAADARTWMTDKLKAESGIAESVERANQLSAVVVDRVDDIAAIEVSSLADLTAKAEFFDELDWWEQGGADAILADIRRLAQGGLN